MIRFALAVALSSALAAPSSVSGDSDFLLIAEADDAESLLAALMATAAAGAITDVTSARAWTGAEFKAVAAKASKAAAAYRPPGKR